MALFKQIIAMLAFTILLVGASPVGIDSKNVTISVALTASTAWPTLAPTPATPSPKPAPAHAAPLQEIGPNGPDPNANPMPANFYCDYTAVGTCQVGLELSYDEVIMDIFIWDDQCQ